jgi:hypothetical protein
MASLMITLLIIMASFNPNAPVTPEYRPVPRVSAPEQHHGPVGPTTATIFGTKVEGGGYEFSHDYGVKKNPFIEGMANYRDFLQYRFKPNSKVLKSLLATVVIFPLFIGGMDYYTNYTQERVFNKVREGLGIKVAYDEYFMKAPQNGRVGKNNIQRETQQ